MRISLDEMTEREKVIRGVECCNHMGREQYRGGCSRCPYFSGNDDIGKALCRKLLAEDVMKYICLETREGAGTCD